MLACFCQWSLIFGFIPLIYISTAALTDVLGGQPG